MSDSDPFADLGETLDDGDETDESKAAQEREGEESSSSGSAETEEAAVEEEVARHDPKEDPAFSYEDANQRPFYAREETIDDFDSWLRYELERELSERGYKNIVVREMTDALLRTVVEEDLVNTVAERFIQARERESSE